MTNDKYFIPCEKLIDFQPCETLSTDQMTDQLR